jgi:hypothetical protein
MLCTSVFSQLWQLIFWLKTYMNIRRLQRPSLHGYRVSSVHCTPYFSNMHFNNIVLYPFLHSKWLRSKILPHKNLFTFLASLSNLHYDLPKNCMWFAKIMSCNIVHWPIGKEIHRLLWNPKVHYRVHKSPPLDPILRQLNPFISVYTLAFLFIIHFYITSFSHLPLDLLTDLFTPILQSECYVHLSSLCSCYISCPSPRFYLIKFME